MTKRLLIVVFVCGCFVCAAGSATCGAMTENSPYVKWKNGPSHSDKFFPIAVWLQDPANAAKYKAAGINTYVGLWQGPTEKQLAQLKQAGMKLICSQNATGLNPINDRTIIGWMHGDEPDNAQDMQRQWKDVSRIKQAWPDAPEKTFEEWGKWGPPVPPKDIQAGYAKVKAADPSRPVFLNLGQGVAYDNYVGRGIRTRRLEDYPEYMKGCDIVSFDIYPVVHNKQEVTGKLWYVARGVDRLVKWGAGEKVVWNCIECTRIDNAELKKATPHQVKCEVWMSIIHGSMGLVYFVHEWQPKFNEAALLDDPEILAAVTAVNRQVTELAPVLNSSTVTGRACVASSNENVPIALMMKEYKDAVYVFAVGMREGSTDAIFTLGGIEGRKPVEVLGESRTIESINGVFRDKFEPWDVHIYRLM